MKLCACKHKIICDPHRLGSNIQLLSLTALQAWETANILRSLATSDKGEEARSLVTGGSQVAGESRRGRLAGALQAGHRRVLGPRLRFRAKS